MISRRTVAAGLERAHLEGPAYRAFEWCQTLPALPEILFPSRREGTDGLPLPPPLLRVQVIGTTRPGEFLAQGHRAATTISDALARAGRQMTQQGAILDFGCGSGRVARRWAHLPGPDLHGSDYNPALVKWCQTNLPFATFRTNGLAPPLDYDDGQFDLVYALSVFTHLDEALQHQWIAELRRVVKPGGLLLFSTRGGAWIWKLTPEEQLRYDSGRLVVRYAGVEGTNLCAAFHPLAYVHNQLASGFTVRESLPAGLEDGAQDLHVLERAR